MNILNFALREAFSEWASEEGTIWQAEALSEDARAARETIARETERAEGFKGKAKGRVTPKRRAAEDFLQKEAKRIKAFEAIAQGKKLSTSEMLAALPDAQNRVLQALSLNREAITPQELRDLLRDINTPPRGSVAELFERTGFKAKDQKIFNLFKQISAQVLERSSWLEIALFYESLGPSGFKELGPFLPSLSAFVEKIEPETKEMEAFDFDSVAEPARDAAKELEALAEEIDKYNKNKKKPINIDLSLIYVINKYGLTSGEKVVKTVGDWVSENYKKAPRPKSDSGEYKLRSETVWGGVEGNLYLAFSATAF